MPNRFAGTTTLKERVPRATTEELQALIGFFDTESLRRHFAELIALARAELKRRETGA